MSTLDALRGIWTEARPLIEEQLAIAEKIAALRDAATAKGLDWSLIKALLKAVIADEEKGGGRVEQILEKASTATAYADMLGLSAILNENKYYRSPIGGPVEPAPAASIDLDEGLAWAARQQAGRAA